MHIAESVVQRSARVDDDTRRACEFYKIATRSGRLVTVKLLVRHEEVLVADNGRVF